MTKAHVPTKATFLKTLATLLVMVISGCAARNSRTRMVIPAGTVGTLVQDCPIDELGAAHDCKMRFSKQAIVKVKN